MIELTYKKNVEKYISNNLEVLETSLDKVAQEYLSLKKRKKSLDFGERLTPKRLDEMAPVVVAKTMDFLEVKKSPDCYTSTFYPLDVIKRSLKIAAGTFAITAALSSYNGLTTPKLIASGLTAAVFGAGAFLVTLQNYLGSSFNCTSNHLMIEWTGTVSAVGSIAHEYTHCLQHNLTELDVRKRNPIVEGHARGLEGIISGKYAEQYDNPAYTYEYIQQAAKELKDAYLYTCRKKKISPKKSLKKLPIKNVRGPLFIIGGGHHYSIGTAAMTIASAKQGEKVYKDVMKNDFEFLRN